ncbi:MAG TPA: hypothetical protein VKR53_09750, partial [Puia sp.]|nr:hypothetical protein [Puia sp.]
SYTTDSSLIWNAGTTEYLGHAIANCVFVDGNDVYIGGAVRINDTDRVIATYWKNGVPVTLPSSTSNTYITGLHVSGSDVYAAGSGGLGGGEGWEWNDSALYALFWKNGQSFKLDSVITPITSVGFASGCYANGLFVSGTDVYVAGNSNTGACYWKNGVITDLTAAPDTNAGASAVYVQGSDVYACGATNINGTWAATVWKNGSPVMLPADAGSRSYTNSMWVSGTDVYICGMEILADGSQKATYWKNGVLTILAGPGTNSQGSAIAVKGSDVYVAGYNDGRAAYWKNGILTYLSSTNSVATGIFVR